MLLWVFSLSPNTVLTLFNQEILHARFPTSCTANRRFVGYKCPHRDRVTAHIRIGWREAVNIVLWECCGASNMPTVPVNETRAEVAALLFPDVGNCCPALCLLSALVSRWDCGRSLSTVRTGYWRKINHRNPGVENKKKKGDFLAHHQVYFIQLLWGEEVVGGWVGA